MEDKIKEILINLIDDIDYNYAAFVSPEVASDYANSYTEKILKALKNP